MEKIRFRDGKKSDPGSRKTSRIRNTGKFKTFIKKDFYFEKIRIWMGFQNLRILQPVSRIRDV
jgi:hypothetical protein